MSVGCRAGWKAVQFRIGQVNHVTLRKTLYMCVLQNTESINIVCICFS